LRRPENGVLRIAAVLPTFRAQATIRTVVERALEVADLVIVVDDACPEHSSDLVLDGERVVVLRHEVNQGVGGATKTGIREALRRGAEFIVKIDSDDQMDVSYVPSMIALLERYAEIDLVKGNRFADAATLHTMPPARLIGNAGLTLLVKFSSGYWTIVDPTNGFIAARAHALRRIGLERLNDRYFFEIDLLCEFGLGRRTIAEMEMPAIYAGEHSSLSIPRVLFEFPPRLLSRFVRRLIVNYAIVEINVGTLCAAIGFPLLLFGIFFGGHEWLISSESGIPRTPGTVILALLLFMIGFQLSLQALLYDVQFSTRTLKVRRGVTAGGHEPDHVFSG
jgi:dolichol-phosphate mannosyltransferase